VANKNVRASVVKVKGKIKNANCVIRGAFSALGWKDLPGNHIYVHI
jgi:hypothetical protein